jgi:phage-related minor tail protein
MSALAAGMIDQLKEEASDLAARQKGLGDETENAQEGEGERLKDGQGGINELADELLEKIDQSARSLGNFNENATEDLLRGARNSRDGGIERSGKRAENSLLYEAFPQAKKEQDKVADNLNKLSDDLQGVADKLRNLGNGALRELVEKLQEAQEDIPGMTGDELKEEAEELAKSIGSLPNAEQDERLQNLTQFFEQLAINENPSQSSSMASAAVSDALELVEQFFWKQAVENRLRRNQETSSAPGRYKKQVEEYFRRIAEGE